jgi:hypothetical protein
MHFRAALVSSTFPGLANHQLCKLGVGLDVEGDKKNMILLVSN